MTHDPQMEMMALDWVIRQRDPAFADWEAFADWLGADEAHQRIYHELASLDADVDGLPEPVGVPAYVPADAELEADIVPMRANRRWWIGGAIAASLALVVSIGLLQRPGDDYRIQTAMGEMQTIALADGSRIAVNGGSSILLSRSDPRRATLERGQALFRVVHRPDAPFRVSVGEAQLVDIGTVFDVTRANAQMTVSVSEGAVAYNPDAANVRVDAGHRLAVRDDGAAALTRISLASVGGWNSGQLIYSGIPLGDVAAEVTRTTGVQIRTAPGASLVLFRGALQVSDAKTEDGAARIVADLAALSGTRATQQAGGWTLSK